VKMSSIRLDIYSFLEELPKLAMMDTVLDLPCSARLDLYEGLDTPLRESLNFSMQKTIEFEVG